MNKWLKIVQHLLGRCLPLPCYCELCLQPSRTGVALCRHCEGDLPWLSLSCPCCALTTHQEGSLCFLCQHCPPPFKQLQALFDYAWPVSNFIGQFKYHEKLFFGKLLGKLMVERLTMSTAIDCIIPMPLSPSRQRQRGFNQTLELAKYIAHYHQRHLDRRSCTKIKETAPQSQLSLEQRSKNITAKAFHIAPSFSAQHVLVIEDVVTTGHTINALTTALKCAGVATVEIWSVCRTLKVPRQN